MNRLALGALLAFAAAITAEAGQAVQLPGWLRVSSQHSGEDAARSYERFLRGWMLRSYSTQKMYDSAIADPRLFRFDPRWPRERPDQGNSQVIWKFFHTPPEQWPHAAYRLTLPSSSPYRVEAEVFCGPSTSGCKEVFNDLETLKAPEISATGELRTEWIGMVGREACDAAAGPKNAAPGYPPEAMRRRIGGRVEIRGIVNTCGDVRSVSVATTSGDRLLDESATKIARRWRVSPLILGGKAGTFGAAIVFVPAPKGSDFRDSRTEVESIWNAARISR